jgi:hypothetical protein
MVAFDNWSARALSQQSDRRWRKGDQAVLRRDEGRLSSVQVRATEDNTGQVLVCLDMMRRGRGRRVYPFLAPANQLFATAEEALCA